tara:strand:+ start:72 stop:410 length:339 start_codon:yes stop_codon:yes gene_type:complete
MAIPDNVKNPSIYKKAKAKAKAKFDVYPSAYANAYMVKEYKKMGGKYAKDGGIMEKSLKPIPASNKGLPNLPKKVRNQMGYMKNGGAVKSFIARGCGAIDPSRRKKTKMRMS